MAVFRVEKNSGYTVMSNHHLRNRALSLKAKGLLSQMLSLPEDWDYTLQGLALIFYGNVVLPFVDRFPKDTELYRVMTTKPEEVSESGK